MKSWERVVTYFYDRTIRNKGKEPPVSRTIMNLNDAKTIGLLFRSEDEPNIAAFAEQLQAKGKSVQLLRFINDTKTELNGDGFSFNRKGLNWYQIPTNEKALAFAEQEFDLLLSCHLPGCRPLEYLSFISKAKWRVGPYHSDKTTFYDFMVNLGEHQEVSYFLAQAAVFLNQLHYDRIIV